MQKNNLLLPQPNFQPKVPKKPSLPSWLSILIISIVAIIVVGLVSWVTYRNFVSLPSKLPTKEEKITPTPLPIEEPTGEVAGWRIYRDEDLGIELKYPENWQVEKFEGKKNFIKIKQPEGQLFLTISKILDSYHPYKGMYEYLSCKSEESIQIGDIKTNKCIYQSTSDLAIEGFRINFERGYTFEEGWLEIRPISYSIKGEYFSNLPKEEINKLNYILASIEFITPKLSKEDIKKQICRNQPSLVRLSFKYNDAANKVFVEEKGKLKPLTAEEWKTRGYKWPCVDRYYIEDGIPDKILDKLPESDLLTKAESDIDNWKTYSNIDLGIEFRYPPEWADFWESHNRIESRVPVVGRSYTRIGPFKIKIDCAKRDCDWAIKDIESLSLLKERTFLITSKSNYSKTLCYFIKVSGQGHDFYLEYIVTKQSDYPLSIFATILSTFKFIK